MAPTRSKKADKLLGESTGLAGQTVMSQNDGGALCSKQFVIVDRREWMVDTEWRDLGSGRAEPVAVTVTSVAKDGPVRADLIRRLPIGTLHQTVRLSAHDLLAMITTHAEQFPLLTHVADLWAPIADSKPRRGVRVTSEDLERVAAVYRDAWGYGLPVTKAVAQALQVSESTAGKRIMRARAAGLLDDIRRIHK